MGKTTSGPVLQLVRGIAEDHHMRELPDQDLLRRFSAEHDEAAFQAMLRRHGPMVLGVCRSVLKSEADAEDAFQATFLILARKFASIRRTESLGSWLHRIAYRTSLRAKAQSARRKKHEACTQQRQASEEHDLSWREVQQVLHEELNSLSERYKGPLAACYLGGDTQDRAARRLGLAKSTLKERRGLVRFAAFSPNGKALATGSLVRGNGQAEDEVILWDVKARKLKHKVTLKDPVTLYQLAFSPDGKTLAIGTNLGIELRAAETGQVQSVLKGGHRAGTGVFALAFSPDGKVLASGGCATENTIRIWDVQEGKLKWTLEGHSDEVVGLTFSPDGKTLASTGGQDDPTIRLWDAETGKAKLALKVDYQPWSSGPLAFSPDGKILGRGSGASVVFFDVQTGEVKDKIIAEQESASILESLAFSPMAAWLPAAGHRAGSMCGRPGRLTVSSTGGLAT